MSKPYIHAKSSARRYGGEPEDYMDIHEEMDLSKSALADVRHRAVYHSAFGIYVIQRIFGQTRTNSAGKTYSVRDIAEQHVMEDLGFIPSLEKWMEGAEIKPWMMGKREPKNRVTIPFGSIKPNPVPAPEVPLEYVWPRPAIPEPDFATTHPDFTRTITID